MLFTDWAFRITLPILLAVGSIGAAQSPKVEIANGLIHATVFLPNPVHSFYRGTRFDWSGMIGHLEYAGHNYYGPWFTKIDPAVSDFVYRGSKSDIVAGPCSAAVGPAEEFLTNKTALGYDRAAPGGTFVKIGVGILRKPDSAPYSSYRLYAIVDGGKWSVQTKPQSVEFTQEILDPSSGYGYLYRKIVRLTSGKPEMVIEHTITNSGRRTIETSVYDHNFLVLDHQMIGPDFTITVPSKICAKEPVSTALGGIQANSIVYHKRLEGRQSFASVLTGCGPLGKDYDIRIENSRVRAGMRITADRPLESEKLWSIRSVLAVEPFIYMFIKPGQSFSWKYSYFYYSLPRE